jgi:hypothetical protein
MQSLTLQGSQHLTLHEETFLRNFNKKFPQEKRCSASRRSVGSRSKWRNCAARCFRLRAGSDNWIQYKVEVLSPAFASERAALTGGSYRLVH